MIRSYPQAVDYLYRLQWFGQKLGLENIRGLLGRLSDPHLRYPAVHIAGTNGKGSTAAITETLLRTQGFRTGLYTSPHLVDFSERIRIDGVPIPHEKVAELTDRIARLAESDPERRPTFFEFTTAMAFLYFAECSVEAAVIEVGMGGRLDATNAVASAVSVVTHIDYDHQAHLGETLAQIAFEKAGIIKPGVPTVTAETGEEALEVITRACEERASRLYRLGKDFGVQGESPQEFDYHGIEAAWRGLSMPLLGRHQLANAGVALAAVELLVKKGLSVTESAVRKGLPRVVWEGRLEAIEEAGRPVFLLDGAHNPGGARALRDFLVDWKVRRGGRLFMVVGILQDKDISSVLSLLVPLADGVILTRPDYYRAAPVSDLEKKALPFGRPVRLQEPVSAAVDLAGGLASPKDTVCITGSLFTVGEARAHLKRLDRLSPLKG